MTALDSLLPTRARRGAGRLASFAEALLTPHGIDRYLELIDPMLVRREIRGVVTDVRHQTADTVTLTVRPSRAWRGFSAGQYVRVSVDIDGVRRTRCYSPAGSQHDHGGLLELTVKADPQGLVSRYLHENAEPGMVLGLSQPDGTFTVPDRRPVHMLLISGGSGITPVLSMLRTLVDEGHPGRITFLHYANTAEDVLYREELAELAERHPGLRVVFCHTHAGGGDLQGFFSAKHLEKVAPWYRDAQTYLCGPTPLMDSVREVYGKRLSERLHTEEFAPPALDLDTENATGQVRFAHSGKEIANSGRPILEQAEEAGLRPEHGCRMGICFSCTKVKTSGCVRNAMSGGLSTEENEEIQLCISVPVGDVEINC
jgi:ferredoxin-NADP reductase